MPARDAHNDGNQQFSILGVQGNLGTADTQGTASTLPIGVDPNGAMYVNAGGALPTSGNNSSAILHYNAAMDLVYADEIIAGVTYRTTFTRNDSVITSTLNISAAVVL
jgi:hypothetical protein